MFHAVGEICIALQLYSFTNFKMFWVLFLTILKKNYNNTALKLL